MTTSRALFFAILLFAQSASAGLGMLKSAGHAPELLTFAGDISAGVAQNGTGTNASFDSPTGVAVDSSGNVYVADTYNNMIRKISPAGVVTTFAGSTISGSTDGTGTAATFSSPNAVAIDSAGNVYVADTGNNMIRKISSAGVVTTLAGSSSYGSTNGTGTAATFASPSAVAVDSAGNVYVADTGNNMIRKISSAGVVTTLAGSTGSGSTNGSGTAAKFNTPSGVAVDSSGNVYVADSANNMIRAITSAGVVTTFAGNTGAGSTNGTGTAAKFHFPYAVAVDSTGNIYVADSSNNMIRVITSAAVVTTLAGSPSAGSTNGTGTAARFNNPSGVAVDASGNVYVGDYLNNLIRAITSAGVVTTLAGQGTTSGATNGTKTAAKFSNPEGIASDSSGNIYVADTTNNLIRKITSAGVVTTLAGSTTSGSADGTGTAARFSAPQGVVADSSGNIYVADSANNVIRFITPTGVVTTIAGSGTAGSSDGTGTAASFHYPTGIAIDSSGIVYVVDSFNNMIRKVTSAGVVTTLAGNTIAGSTNGTGAAAKFNSPAGIAIDSAGNVYIADSSNNMIRKITSAGVTTTFAGSTTSGSTNGSGTAARFNSPNGLAIDSTGNIYVADSGNSMIRKISSLGVVTTIAGAQTSPYFSGCNRLNANIVPNSLVMLGNRLYISVADGVIYTLP